MGLQILLLCRWAPECSKHSLTDLDKVLPPTYQHQKFFPGYTPKPGDDADKPEKSRGGHKPDLTVYAGAAMLGNIGATACVIFLDTNIVHRGLHIHGTVIMTEQPVYLDEVTILHALRTLRYWLQTTDSVQTNMRSMTIYAGSFKAVVALQDWFAGGTLKLKSAAASPLISDISDIEQWLQARLNLKPFDLPMETETPTDLPVYHSRVLAVFEEFRQFALPALGAEWEHKLPRVPLTKQELKRVVRRQWENDEILAIRQLAEVGSVSAGILTRLQITREIVHLTMSMLRRERAAQVTLISILGGTRFKHHFHGVLVPTRCPKLRNGRRCGSEDSYEHLLRCYGLRRYERTGPDALDFLVLMARKAIPPVPGMVDPMYVARGPPTETHPVA